MKTLLLAFTTAALLVPAAAWAVEPTEDGTKSPAQWCKAEREKLGDKLFKDTYGTNRNKSNAFGKCVSRKAQTGTKSKASAASACRAEQADPAFAAAHGGKTFDQFYGTGKHGSNAFGKCVSSKAKAAAEAEHLKTVNAARECKKERAADPAAFRAKYGKNENGANAFGKCVSARAKNSDPSLS